MSKRTVVWTALCFLLTSVLIAIDVQHVNASGALYIKADGSIEPSTAPIQREGETYTLTSNITSDVSGIVVERDNIVLNGGNHPIVGGTSGFGVDVSNKNNVTVRNMLIQGFEIGIFLKDSYQCILTNNTVTGSHAFGIALSSSSRERALKSMVSENIVTANINVGIVVTGSDNRLVENRVTGNGWTGIDVGGSWVGCSASTIEMNTIDGNGGDGIRVYKSSGTIITDNFLSTNYAGVLVHGSSTNNVLKRNSISQSATSNFYVVGESLSDFVNDVDPTNTVNGRAIYYLISKRDITVPLDAGYTALVNCTHITVQNLSLTGNGQGLLLAFTTNSTIASNDITRNENAGIHLIFSSRNAFLGNHIADSSCGIYLESSSFNSIIGNSLGNLTDSILLDRSSNNSISGNTVTRSLETAPGDGIVFRDSSGNNVSENKMENNRHGISLSRSSDNSIFENEFANNYWGSILLGGNSNNNNIQRNRITHSDPGILLQSSSSNNLFGNNLSSNGLGISLKGSSRNNLEQNYIANHSSCGIRAESSLDNTILGNTIINGHYGISLDSNSCNNLLCRNIVKSNDHGINMQRSLSNVITENNIVGNEYGMYAVRSSQNRIYHNNFMHNVQQIYTFMSANAMADDYPSGGNYWSDYTGIDLEMGPYQNETGCDGIGDTMYVIDANNTDHYPLMGAFNRFDAGCWSGVACYVDVVSDSTVSDFSFNALQKTMTFKVTGSPSTVGFCRVTIPNALLRGPYTISINNSSPETVREMSNGTHTFLYFTYENNSQEVSIIGTTAVPTVFGFPLLWLSLIAISLIGCVIAAIVLLRTRKHRH